MEIWFVFVLPSGGMDTLNRERIRALTAAGIPCRLVYFREGSGTHAGPMPCPVHYTRDPEQLRLLLQQHPPSAIVLTSWFLELNLFRGLGFNGALIFEIQGLGPPDEAHRTLVDAHPFIQPYASAILHPCTPVVERLLPQIYPAMPTFAFPNPIDRAHFRYRPGPGREALPMILIWIGRIQPNKNWLEFLKIGQALLARGENPQLWMFEDPELSTPEDRAALTGAIHQLGLINHVQLLPNISRPHMQDYFAIASDSGGMLVMTSLSEGAPYAVLEAMSCRCPVLTTDNDGVRPMIQDGVQGLYYKLGDIEGAAAAAQRLRHDGALRRSIMDNAEAKIDAVYHPAHYVAQFQQMLRRLRVM